MNVHYGRAALMTAGAFGSMALSDSGLFWSGVWDVAAHMFAGAAVMAAFYGDKERQALKEAAAA